jgi:hypothetical protein
MRVESLEDEEGERKKDCELRKVVCCAFGNSDGSYLCICFFYEQKSAAGEDEEAKLEGRRVYHSSISFRRILMNFIIK